MRKIEISDFYRVESIVGKQQMLVRIVAIIGLFIPSIVMADHYLKNGSYMCELAWDYDGNQAKHCFSRRGQEYDCIGYQIDLSDDALTVHRKNDYDILVKISESSGLFDDGRHVDSMVFVNQLEDGSHGSILKTLNFVYGEPNLIHLKTIKYDETAYRDITSDNIMSDPYLIKTFSHFSRCERLQ